MGRRLLPLLVLTALGCSTAKSVEVRDAAILAKLERKECYGACPVYTVTVWSNGRVDWHGERCVKLRGDADKQVPPETLKALGSAFNAAGYCQLETEYSHVDRTDAATALTAYTGCGFLKSVRHYQGDTSAPPALGALEKKLDELLGTAEWVGPDEKRDCRDDLR